MSERGNCFPFLRKVNGHASGEERNFASPPSGYALLKERRKNGPRASVRFSRYRYVALNPFSALHRFESVSNSILDFSRGEFKIFRFFFFLRIASLILGILKLCFVEFCNKDAGITNFFLTRDCREIAILFCKMNLKGVALKFCKFSIVSVGEKWIEKM